jgi:hypothetical protein
MPNVKYGRILSILGVSWILDTKLHKKKWSTRTLRTQFAQNNIKISGDLVTIDSRTSHTPIALERRDTAQTQTHTHTHTKLDH